MKGNSRLFRVFGVVSISLASLAAVSTTSGRHRAEPLPRATRVDRASLSLTGDFSGDGQAFQQGYNLWAADQNKNGGLLGHKIELKILNDTSTPTQVVTNYQALISSDHVNLTFGPFSSLLTLPAARAVSRYGYAMVEGAGGAPSVFQADFTMSLTRRCPWRMDWCRSRSGSPRCPPVNDPRRLRT